MGKWWVKLIISFLAGGIVSELIIIQTKGQIGLNAFILGIFFYVVITIVYGIAQLYHRIRNSRTPKKLHIKRKTSEEDNIPSSHSQT